MLGKFLTSFLDSYTLRVQTLNPLFKSNNVFSPERLSVASSVSAAARLPQSGPRHSSSYSAIVLVPALPTQTLKGLLSTFTNSIEVSHGA